MATFKQTKKNQVEGLTDHIMTVAEQINPRSFFSRAEGPDLTRLLDVLLRYIAGARPVNNRPLDTAMPLADIIPKMRHYLLEIHRVLRWDMTDMTKEQERFFLATFATAWTQYRYSGKLPDNFGIARKK